jgi:hypothetical protein
VAGNIHVKDGIFKNKLLNEQKRLPSQRKNASESNNPPGADDDRFTL